MAIIAGTGSCLPKCRITNNQISTWVDTSDQWIRERTGIRERRIAAEETTVMMAYQAGKKALEQAKCSPEEVDLILVATISGEQVFPGTACGVQKLLQAQHAAAFDINGACTGFVLAYHVAESLLETGGYQTVLVIGSECLSHITDWTDRGTCILFGDGAGAVLLQKSIIRPYLSVIHSDGEKGEALTCRSRNDGVHSNLCQTEHPFLGGGKGRERFAVTGTKNSLPSDKDRNEEAFCEIQKGREESFSYFMKMDGQAVFKFAVKKVPEVMEEVLRKNRLEKQEIRYYVLHQANRRIVEAVARRMEEPIGKFPMNLDRYGNTSSASIPILLDEMNRDGKLRQGDKLILAGFGAGLTWGAVIVEWK